MHRQDNQNIEYDRILIERLNYIIPKIVDAFDPLEIIMYGSYARGDNDIYSDIDIIIIVKEINMRFQDRSIKAIDVVGEDEKEIPINPIVYTEEEFLNMLKQREGFLISALEESVLVWKSESSSNLERQLESNEIKSNFKKFLPQE